MLLKDFVDDCKTLSGVGCEFFLELDKNLLT